MPRVQIAKPSVASERDPYPTSRHSSKPSYASRTIVGIRQIKIDGGNITPVSFSEEALKAEVRYAAAAVDDRLGPRAQAYIEGTLNALELHGYLTKHDGVITLADCLVTILEETHFQPDDSFSSPRQQYWTTCEVLNRRFRSKSISPTKAELHRRIKDLKNRNRDLQESLERANREKPERPLPEPWSGIPSDPITPARLRRTNTDPSLAYATPVSLPRHRLFQREISQLPHPIPGPSSFQTPVPISVLGPSFDEGMDLEVPDASTHDDLPPLEHPAMDVDDQTNDESEVARMLQIQNDKLQETITRRDQTIEEQILRPGELQTTLRNLRDDYSQLTADTEERKRRINQLEATTERLREGKKKLAVRGMVQRMHLRREIDSLQQDLQSEQAALQLKQEEHANSKQKLAESEKRAETAHRRADWYEAKVKKLISTAEEMKASLSEAPPWAQ